MNNNLNQPKVEEENSILYLEFRKAMSWGWNIIASLAIISALVSQSTIKSWQINYAISLSIIVLISNLLDRRYQSALFYAPVLLFMFFSPLFLNDPDQKPWISIGFIAVAAIFSVSNIENVWISLLFSTTAIILQQYIANLNLPSITDSKDLLLLRGYFGVSWCILLQIGLLYIRQGYIKYHTTIEHQLTELYENQLVSRGNALAINTQDYLNLQLHGTVLNTLIYARDNIDLNDKSNRERLSKLINSDLNQLARQDSEESEIQAEILKTLNSIGGRNIEINLTIIQNLNKQELNSSQLMEILREKVLNLKKHTSATVCNIEVSVQRVPTTGFAFIRPPHYRLTIRVSENSIQNGDNPEIQFKQVLSSKSLNRILSPLLAKQRTDVIDNLCVHTIEIPLLNFQPNAIERLLDLRFRSQEFVAKSYVLISMLYGAICLPALLRLDIDLRVLSVLTVIVLGSAASVFAPRFNSLIIIGNSLLCLLPLPISVYSQDFCGNLTYLPWIFNCLIGPIFFASLTISNRVIRWLPISLFFIESIFVTNALPANCQDLLAGSTPAIVVLSLLAVIVNKVRTNRSHEDKEIISKFQETLDIHSKTNQQISQERDEIISELSNFAAELSSTSSSGKELLSKVKIHILKIRALLVSAEYFDHKIVSDVYKLVKKSLEKNKLTELHILTDSFNYFKDERSTSHLIDLFSSQTDKHISRVTISYAQKTEIHFATSIEAQSETSPAVLFEDENIKLSRA